MKLAYWTLMVASLILIAVALEILILGLVK
jgi:hypothetical protein